MFKSKKIDKSVLIGALSIMLAALLWSLDGVFIRPKFYMLPAGLVVFIEHLLGFIILSPFIIMSWYKIKKLDRRDWGAIFWVALFGGVIGTLFITKAFFAAILGSVTFATVVLLQKLQPVFALLLARIVLKEKLSRLFYLWALIAIVAAGFLAFGKTGIGEINWLNNAAIFAIIAAFAFGSSTVFGKRIVNHLDFKPTAALRFGLTSILILIYILITGDITEISAVSSVQWWLLALIVFTSGAGAIFIYYFGLKKVPASAATIAELFWPFSAVILDYILNGNVLNSIQIVAALVLLLAFYMIVKYGKQKKKTFIARVIDGVKRGRRLGFPTANLDKVDIDISHGIYAVEVGVDKKTYKGALHFGPKDTFKEGPTSEVILKDFEGNLYGKDLQVRILKKIRDIRKYKSIKKLKKAIGDDLDKI
jgi:drug/metabolite transporter (DMT)-like permease